GVVDLPVRTVELRAIWVPSKLAPEEHVVDSAIAKHTGKQALLEMRDPPRVWTRADVGERRDAMLLQQPQKMRGRVIRVPDGVERDHFRCLSFLLTLLRDRKWERSAPTEISTCLSPT